MQSKDNFSSKDKTMESDDSEESKNTEFGCIKKFMLE